MFQRVFDCIGAIVGLLLFSPIILIALVLVWLQDRKNPIYSSQRLGLNAQKFTFYKIRSMVVGADKSGVYTVKSDDPKVTALGSFLRKSKIDEFLQFFSVLKGDMSLVGPRPNLPAVAESYTRAEHKIMDVKPGITDFSSIVFSDLDAMMAGSEDVNKLYDQRIRPWKSRLAILYANNKSVILDIQLIFLTALNFFSRQASLKGVGAILRRLDADQDLIRVANRTQMPEVAEPPQ